MKKPEEKRFDSIPDRVVKRKFWTEYFDCGVVKHRHRSKKVAEECVENRRRIASKIKPLQSVEERYAAIIGMREDEGMTFKKIGESLPKQITPGRAQSLYNSAIRERWKRFKKVFIPLLDKDIQEIFEENAREIKELLVEKLELPYCYNPENKLFYHTLLNMDVEELLDLAWESEMKRGAWADKPYLERIDTAEKIRSIQKDRGLKTKRFPGDPVENPDHDGIPNQPKS